MPIARQVVNLYLPARQDFLENAGSGGGPSSRRRLSNTEQTTTRINPTGKRTKPPAVISIVASMESANWCGSLIPLLPNTCHARVILRDAPRIPRNGVQISRAPPATPIRRKTRVFRTASNGADYNRSALGNCRRSGS